MTALTTQVEEILSGIHRSVTDCYTQLDPTVQVNSEVHELATGHTRPIILTEGQIIEKAAVLFTSSTGSSLPPAASERNPQLAGSAFSAVSVSTIVHPRNPHIPTVHMNLRFFQVHVDPPHWHFGGGMDLTPYIPYKEDCELWHRNASRACGSDEVYRILKKQCDEYFYLPHRQEHRGIGGLFFDDWTTDGFQDSLSFIDRIGQCFVESYSAINNARKDQTWTEEEEEWLLYRRGRYAEFNLIYDRGTRYGIQSGRRIESVLASLPPRVKWIYQFSPTNDELKSIESRLGEALVPQEWC